MTTLPNFPAVDEKLLRQEELILEATELIATIMQENGISKAQLAQRLGKSKAFVTQCLSGQQNLTLRTLADLFGALEHRARLKSESSSYSCRTAAHMNTPLVWAFERSIYDDSETIDCAASSAMLHQAEAICDAA